MGKEGEKSFARGFRGTMRGALLRLQDGVRQSETKGKKGMGGVNLAGGGQNGGRGMQDRRAFGKRAMVRGDADGERAEGGLFAAGQAAGEMFAGEEMEADWFLWIRLREGVWGEDTAGR